jgi:hypothetical protein
MGKKNHNQVIGNIECKQVAPLIADCVLPVMIFVIERKLKLL